MAARATASAIGERVAIRLAASLAGPGVAAAQFGDDVGDRLAGEALVDPVPLGQKGTGGRLRRVRGQGGVDAVGHHRSLEGGEGVVRDEVVGETHRDGVGAGERGTCQRGVQAKAARVRATAGSVPPTSGMKPMPTSGMPIFVVSVTTRMPACALTPTPPPITMPSITATYGLG